MSTHNMTIRFWGVRGSQPVSGDKTIRYGGNTSCIEIRCDDSLIILDAGTGITNLGNRLQDAPHSDIHLFLTHTHFDHINGFPFFKPLHKKTQSLTLWAGHLSEGKTIQSTLETLLSPAFFPVPLPKLKANIVFKDFKVGETFSSHENILVNTIALNHPGGATGYRIHYHGHAICYITDMEHTSQAPDPALVKFVEQADILIYDASYADEEFEKYIGWGHSTWQQGARLAEKANVSQYIPTHHYPGRTDDELDALQKKLSAWLPNALFAKEGLTITLRTP